MIADSVSGPSSPTDARSRRDTGVTLIELVVAMGIMGIVLAIVTGAIVSMFHATTKVEGITTTSSQVNVALSRLDSTVRYASGVGEPARDSAGNWTVAFQTTYTGTPVCTQLRINMHTNQLQQRTWTVEDDGSAADVTGWRPLASQIALTVSGGTTLVPFPEADTESATHEQLRVRFSSVSGASNRSTVTDTDVTFTAMNSSAPTDDEDAPDTNLCQEVDLP